MNQLNKLGIAVAVALGAITGCGGGSDEPTLEQVAVLPLSAAVDGNWPIGQYVYRSDVEWQAAWNARGSTVEPPTEKPAVDFQRFVLVGFSAGTSGSCVGLRVNSAARLGTALTVQYEVISAPPVVACGGVASRLLAFIVVPAPVDSVRSELVFAGSH